MQCTICSRDLLSTLKRFFLLVWLAGSIIASVVSEVAGAQHRLRLDHLDTQLFTSNNLLFSCQYRLFSRHSYSWRQNKSLSTTIIMNYDDILKKMQEGVLSGSDLAKLVEDKTITKGERRKLTRAAQQPIKTVSDRQKLRLETKEKKSLPKLTK